MESNMPVRGGMSAIQKLLLMDTGAEPLRMTCTTTAPGQALTLQQVTPASPVTVSWSDGTTSTIAAGATLLPPTVCGRLAASRKRRRYSGDNDGSTGAQ